MVIVLTSPPPPPPISVGQNTDVREGSRDRFPSLPAMHDKETGPELECKPPTFWVSECAVFPACSRLVIPFWKQRKIGKKIVRSTCLLLCLPQSCTTTRANSNAGAHGRKNLNCKEKPPESGHPVVDFWEVNYWRFNFIQKSKKNWCLLSLDSYEPLHHLLTHQNSAVVANACGMLGNILKHSSVFYSTLQR